MKTKMDLLAAGTALFIAGTGVAVAQHQEQPRGGAAEKSAPAEKIAPKAPDGRTGAAPNQPSGAQNGGAETNRRNAAEQGGGRTDSNRTGETQNRGRSETTGQAPQNERRDGQPKEPDRATDERPRNQNRATEERGNERNSGRDRTTTGQGAAPSKGANSNLSPENRTRIHDVFIKEHSGPRVNNVDFDLSVGTPVPRSVRIVAVPREIIEIEPQWRGYEYFMVGDQVVIVDPRSMEIVAVLDV
jgi:hypothetical protein